MIALDVYFNAKDGNVAELERIIVDVWMEAMRQQPGFVSASLMTPFPQEDLESMGAIRPPFPTKSSHSGRAKRCGRNG